MCKTLKLERFLTDSSKNIERNKGFSHSHLGASTSFRKGFGCEVFSTRVNVFFLPYFKLRTIFSGYGMILKRENNFSNRVNDPVPMGQKVPMLTPMDFG